MKTTHVLFFSTMFIIGGIILFNSLNTNQSVSSTSNYSSPTKISESITSTEISPPITFIPTILPTETPVPATPTPTVSKPSSNVQIVKATYGPPLGFYPSELTVKAGIPVRLEVMATMDGRGCMGTITIPGLDNRVQSLVKGQTNILEFTPQTPGEYPITCAMGMSHNAVIIVQ